ncbi:polygalacturonase-like [Senna tora]|uniref:Polygalacturonase-like n=1 Tax=Senna tora TaxID=362788 RepID=A0A834XDP1_9FABA|nr:polygalacturonase-like [Senna tora]
MSGTIRFLHILIFFCSFFIVTIGIAGKRAATTTTYNVLSFGARADGETDSTHAFLRAWAEACGSPEPAGIYVPPGEFRLGSARFRGRCRSKAVSVTIDGTLVAPSDYWSVAWKNWLLFEHVDGVNIRGGVLDGRGAALWRCKNSGGSCPAGATTLRFTNSKNINISHLTSHNSQMFHIVFNGCHNIEVNGVNVTAAGNSPNTDGIHVQLSSHVAILNSNIRTGDDCISIGPGISDLRIENVTCGPGHGISIGSLGKEMKEAGVQNVTVKRVEFNGTQNGVRIKSWGRPSNGFVKNIVFQNIAMLDVYNPIIIDQNYCPNHKGCPGQASGVKIRDVTYKDIHGTSASQVAIKFDCSSKHSCKRIRLEDVKLTYKKQAARALCNHAGGTASPSVQPESCL